MKKLEVFNMILKAKVQKDRDSFHIRIRKAYIDDGLLIPDHIYQVEITDPKPKG